MRAGSTDTLRGGERGGPRIGHTATAYRTAQVETLCHDLEGRAVQRNDTHRILIIDGVWVRFAPVEYQVLLPLLSRFSRPVSAERICLNAFGRSYSAEEDRRLYCHIDRLRSKLMPFGLTIVSLNKKRGYILFADERFNAGAR